MNFDTVSFSIIIQNYLKQKSKIGAKPSFYRKSN